MKTGIPISKPNRNRAHCKSWFDILVENADSRNELRELKRRLRMVSEGIGDMFGLLGVKPGGSAEVEDCLASLRVVISDRMLNAEARERELGQRLQKIIEAHPFLLFDLQP